MDANHFVVKLDAPIHSKEEIFQFVSDHLIEEAQLDLAGLIAERDKEGSIEIANKIILPHIESDLISESQIFVIRPIKEIEWNTKIKKVKLIIMVLLHKDESEEIKREISAFTRKLADDRFLEQLMETKDL